MSNPRARGVESLMRYFSYGHLPLPLQQASLPFCELAQVIADGGTTGPETTTALRKLLEAKDCYVRACLHERVGPDAEPAP